LNGSRGRDQLLLEIYLTIHLHYTRRSLWRSGPSAARGAMLAAGQLWGKSSAASLRPSPWKFSLFPSSARRSQEPEPSTVGSPRPYRGRESGPRRSPGWQDGPHAETSQGSG